MKFILYFIFFYSGLAAYAQNDATAIKKRKKFSVGISYEPKVCFRSASNNEVKFGVLRSATYWLPGNFQYYKYSNKGYEKPQYGYTTGIDFSFFLNEAFSISTGVKYCTVGYRTTYIDTLIYVSGDYNNPQFYNYYNS